MDVKVETVAAQAERVDGAVLIYADSRRGTETWARDLSARLKEPVAAYHAGMPAADRQAVEHRFLTRELRVVAATNAFGMGVDRADIRLVAHVGIPESLDAYYQEIGRGGRDGDPAHALMVWQAADLNRRRWRMRQDAPNDQAVTKILQTLAADVVPGEPRFWQWDRTNETIPLIVSLLEEMGYLDVSEKALSSARLAALEHPWPETLGDLINHRLAMQYQYRLRRFEAMEAYLAPDGPCRRSRILEYFGQLSVPAGVLVECCDRCQQSHTPKAPPSPDAHAALRAWRTQQARALGVPPYLILHDRVLQGIVERMPETLEHLSACPGMGPKKLEQFGREILTVLKAHHPGADSWDASDATAIARAFQLFDSNMAFSLVVERIPRTPSTVLTYLERWIAQAEPDTARAYALSLIRSEQYLAISEAFQLEGDDRLRPVMDRLSGMFSYQDLRVARALYRRLGPSGDDAVKPT
jgi:ATP-dependent DNA helicase RecQ